MIDNIYNSNSNNQAGGAINPATQATPPAPTRIGKKTRRTRSKGTISGYADANNGLLGNVMGSGVYDGSSSTSLPNNYHPLRDSSAIPNNSLGLQNTLTRSQSAQSITSEMHHHQSTLLPPHHQQHPNYAKLALTCVNGAMSTHNNIILKSKLALCPIRMRNRILQHELDKNNYTEAVKHAILKEFEQNEDYFVAEDNELSSGDEDEEDLENEMQSIPAASSIGSGSVGMAANNGMSYNNSTASSSRISITSASDATGSSVGSGSSNASSSNAGSTANSSAKLAFGQRKIRFFDIITAKDKKVARDCLNNELQALKKKDGEALSLYLKEVQNRDKHSLGIVAAAASSNDEFSKTLKADENERYCHSPTKMGGQNVDQHLPIGESVGVTAALILESLALSPKESIEGMSKCYDGLVAAGTALLEEGEKTLLDASGNASVSVTSKQTSSSGSENTRPNRAKVKAVLQPLLITSLSHSSGDVIVSLARLRSLCGTWRYRRRFVQRIAPVLVRPPYAAIWCLKHQNDMGAIVAATELLLDEAEDLFPYGWHERGIQLRNDERKANLLIAAANQLRKLSTIAVAGTNNTLRNNRMLGTQPSRESLVPDPSLAEWEVLAVDHQIRMSISNIFTRDWSRMLVPPPRKISDGDRPVRTNTTTTSSNNPPMSPRAPKISLYSSGPINDTQQLQERSPTKSPTHIDTPQPKIPSSSTPQTPKVIIPSGVGPPPRSPSSPPRGGPNLPTINTSTTPSLPTQTTSITTQAPPPLSPSPSSEMHALPQQQLSRTSANSLSKETASPSSQHILARRNSLLSPAERRRYVQACRALRAQITRFEEAFIQIHGRPPKGATERAPLATTYAQYREWKRAIRSDAACRIQALIRSYQCRKSLRMMKDVRITNFLNHCRSRRGRFVPIPIPLNNANSTMSKPTNHATNSVPAVVMPQPIPPLSPQVQQVQQLSISPNQSNNLAPSNPNVLSSSPPPTSSRSSHDTYHDYPLNRLLDRKRELKNILKRYDMDFYRNRGRMPTKQEKEPIRGLYETYNAIKREINAREGDDVSGNASPRESMRDNTSVSSSTSSTNYSMSSNSNFSGPSQLSQQYIQQQLSASQPPFLPTSSSPSPDFMGVEDMNSSNPFASSHQQQQQQSQYINPRKHRSGRNSPSSFSQTSSDHSLSMSEGTPTTAPSTSSSNMSTVNLDTLRQEKNELHALLRTFERQFYDQHRRQVSSFADIRPVADQYRRYKEIKRQIADLTNNAVSSSGSN